MNKLRKAGMFALMAVFLMASACNTPYHASKRKKGEQCDCPKKSKVKKHKTKKYH